MDDQMHQLVLWARYSLENLGDLMCGIEGTGLGEGKGAEVRGLATCLPYLWSGYRDVGHGKAAADGYYAAAQDIAGRHGVELSANRKDSAVQVLHLIHELSFACLKGKGAV